MHPQWPLFQRLERCQENAGVSICVSGRNVTYARLACWSYRVVSHLTTTTICCNVVRCCWHIFCNMFVAYPALTLKCQRKSMKKTSSKWNVCPLFGAVHAFLVLLVWLTISHIVQHFAGHLFLFSVIGILLELVHKVCCYAERKKKKKSI